MLEAAFNRRDRIMPAATRVTSSLHPNRAMWSLPAHRTILVLAGVAAIATACVAPRTVATFQSADANILLQQPPNGGAYSVNLGSRTSLPLDGYSSARIDSVWGVPGHRLAVIAGSTADCPLRYTLLTAENDTGSLHPIGECGENFAFAQDGNTVVIRESGVRNPRTWTFKDGALSGPTVQVTTRPSRPAAETPSRAIDGAIDATAPPPVVSAPVGDEVLPSPVGGGAAPRSGP